MSNLISKSNALKFSIHSDVVILSMDCPEKSVNMLSLPLLEDLRENLDKIFNTNSYKGLIITSAKENCFGAGADISIFESMRTLPEAEKGAASLQNIFNSLANAKIPVVAAVHGACLGGAFEMVLACKYRIGSNATSTKLGLPEVRIGVIPGGGGTQRLPRLIGLIPALDLILTSRNLDSKKAFKMGVLHAVLPQNQLIAHALEICLNSNISQKYVDKKPSRLKYENTMLSRAFIKKQTLKSVYKTTGGHYPAPLKALDSVLYGINHTLAQGLAFEAKAFAECVMSPQCNSLIHVFRIITAAKKCPVSPEVLLAAKQKWIKPLLRGETSVGMLGAGLMGSGISTVLSEKRIRSVMVDNNAAGLERGMQRINDYFAGLAKKKRISRREQDFAKLRIDASLEKKSLKNSPIIIEAVYEDIKIKNDMLKDLENIIATDFIFASNTSSLPITQIAKAARHPGNIIGMHFFSPVPKMPLVEIIKTPQTHPEVLAATFELAQEMGKNIIVVNDGPAFYTTRVLGFLLAEALNIVSEGVSIEHIDKVMQNFGWPVGPITLIDEVGIDVACHVLDTLAASFSSRLVAPPQVRKFIPENRLGRKFNKGFYLYHGKDKTPDPLVYDILGVKKISNNMPEKEITDRCLYAFIAESLRCLQEGILMSADDGDLGAIFGLGFPPFLGGPFHCINTIGKDKVKARLQELANKYGERFSVDINH